MRYLWCFVFVALCESARIRRGVEHEFFPNFRSVYHGNGATSYQNVQIDSSGSVPIPKNYYSGPLEDLKLNTYEDHQDLSSIPISEPQNDFNADLTHNTASYEIIKGQIAIDHDVPHYYEHYGHKSEYEYS